LKLSVHRLEQVQAGAVSGGVPSVLEVTLPKQPGKGFEALGAEPSDLYVAAVSPGSAAEKAGLRVGDKLVAYNGEPLRSFNFLMGELTNLNEKPFQLTWRSADGTEHTQTLAQAPLSTRDESGQPSPAVLGVRPWLPSSAEMLPLDMVTVHVGVADALVQSVTIVPKIIGQMVTVIGRIITRKMSTQTLGGPVMMYQLASKSAEQGLDSFLHLMAIISINLGVMNLLPIPILDGFGLLAALWEGIRRRPISVRAREVANVVGLILIALLFAMAFYNDFTRHLPR
jgi:regulator of sigma E protease